MFSSIDLAITPDDIEDDIEAFHRLKSNNRVIIKFLNRKTCLKVLKNKKSLKDIDPDDLGFGKDAKLFTNESLCSTLSFSFLEVPNFTQRKENI